MFLATLKPKSLAKLAAFPGLFDARARARARARFREFDNLVTAPLHGFRDTDDYWQRVASGPWLERIRVPTLVLNARNDPFLPERDLLRGRAQGRAVRGARISAHRRPCRIPRRPFPGRQLASATPLRIPRPTNRETVPAEIFRTYDIRGMVGTT